jgi:hypothetical protein
MNYTPLGGWFDIVKAVFVPPSVTIGMAASKVVAQGIVNTTKGDWSGTAPNLGPIKTNMPTTLPPTVPQGPAFDNYILTGNEGTKPTVDNILPKYNISSSTAILKPVTSYNVSSLNLSSLFSTPTTPEPQKPDSLKKYLPYVIIGGVGLVTMFALKG